MPQRDKYGETASERIARKFIASQSVNECNTSTRRETVGGKEVVVLVLYKTDIAKMQAGEGNRWSKATVTVDYTAHSSRLTQDRLRAVAAEATAKGLGLIEIKTPNCYSVR